MEMNRYIKVLLTGSYLWYFGAGLFGPLYALFAQDIGGDILDLTAAYSLYLISTGLLSICVGRLSDSHSRYRLMMAGYAINAMATFGYLLVDTPNKLFVIQALLGVAAAFATPTWDSLFAIHIDRKRIGEEWGYCDGGPNIVSGVALLAGGLVAASLGFATLFILMGTIEVVATCVQGYVVFLKAPVLRRRTKARIKTSKQLPPGRR
jgi:MFS family permease